MPLTTEQALAYLDQKLGKVDPEVIRPLKAYTWTRDLPIANDLDRVTDSIIMRTIKGFAQGNGKIQGKSWIGRDANDLKGVGLDMSAKGIRIFTGGREASWTSMQLERARASDDIGLDTEQVNIINEVFQDEAQSVGYLGDADNKIEGLLNSSQIKTVTGSGLLEAETIDPDKVTAAIDDYMIQAANLTDGVVTPSVLLVSPDTYAKLFKTKRDTSDKSSVLKYVTSESYAYTRNGSFAVYSLKELTGAGKSKKDRAVLYTPAQQYLKYSVMPIWREKTYDRGLEYCAAYLWRIAELQIRRPETLMYIDNL